MDTPSGYLFNEDFRIAERPKKHHILFEITVGSSFKNVGGMFDIPVGGTPQEIDIEFETDSDDPMTVAESLLKDRMKEEYHILYWYWLPVVDNES